MSSLQVGQTYLVRNGQQVRIESRKETGIGTRAMFVGKPVNGGPFASVEYNDWGHAMGKPEMDIVDLVGDQDLGKPPIPLNVELGHAYEDVCGRRHVITGFSNGKFENGVNLRWQPNGRAISDDVKSTFDLVRDLGAVQAADPPKEEKAEDKPSDYDTALPNEPLIQAVLRGEPVQVRVVATGQWETMRNRAYALRQLLNAGSSAEFRLTPKTEEWLLPIYKSGTIGGSFGPGAKEWANPDVVGVLTLVREVNTGKVLSFRHETFPAMKD